MQWIQDSEHTIGCGLELEFSFRFFAWASLWLCLATLPPVTTIFSLPPLPQHWRWCHHETYRDHLSEWRHQQAPLQWSQSADDHGKWIAVKDEREILATSIKITVSMVWREFNKPMNSSREDRTRHSLDMRKETTPCITHDRHGQSWVKKETALRLKTGYIPGPDSSTPDWPNPGLVKFFVSISDPATSTSSNGEKRGGSSCFRHCIPGILVESPASHIQKLSGRKGSTSSRIRLIGLWRTGPWLLCFYW